jgi:hypothetical protein
MRAAGPSLSDAATDVLIRGCYWYYADPVPRHTQARFPYTLLVTQPHGMPGPARYERDETGPVFADPSGQRRRLMRMMGAGGSVLLVGALILVGISLFGGPDTPFSVFGAPIAQRQGQPGTGGAGKQSGPSAPGRPAPGSGSSSSRPGQHASPTRSGAPSPSRSAPTSPTASPSSTPTNGAGKTPPGRTKPPQPHPSPSSSHGR